MSASNNKSSFMFIPGKPLSKATIAVIEATFDAQVDYDIKAIEDDKKDTAALKSLSLIRTILFPFEASLAIIVNREYYRDLVHLQKYYWGFLRNKLSLSDFKRIFSDPRI